MLSFESLSNLFLTHASQVRLIFSALGFALFLGLGTAFPFRPIFKETVIKRWTSNSLITVFNTFLVKFFLPLGLIQLASLYQTDGIMQKTFGQSWLNLFLSLLLLDLIIYWQHRLFHHLPTLWRLHRVHHSDTEFDTTTALRFHTIEIFLSLAIKAFAIFIFGFSAVAILIFEIILNFSAMFNHGNFSLPKAGEKAIVCFFVTPDMHRVHHSIEIHETNSNFGFCLSIWDRLFGSYIKEPERSPVAMPIGLQDFRDSSENTFPKLLTQPFRS